MILKKSQFKFQKKYRGKWPFTVLEVGIGRIDIENEDGVNTAFYILHKTRCFALSGILENHGFAKLEESGIWLWADDIPGCNENIKKSLSPVFEFLQERIK